MADSKTSSNYTPSTSSVGKFVRQTSKFRNVITADGSSGYKAEKGRYVFYLARPCPWCTRVETIINMKGLNGVFELIYVEHVFQNIEGYGKGWVFSDKKPDTLNKKSSMWEVYRAFDASYADRATVPVLFDKHTKSIVNNESADILKMLNREFEALASVRGIDLRPTALDTKIAEQCEWLYDTVNNGVYKCGFASSQAAYDEAASNLFKALDSCEAILSKSKYLCGDQLTESDLRLFVTLVRFDPVYFVHFKCALAHLEEYPALSNYTRHLYQMPAFQRAIDFTEIIEHYFKSHQQINTFGIVPMHRDWPKWFSRAHNREAGKDSTASADSSK